MKRTKLINADLSATIARLGHHDTLVVADAGLPIPRAPTRIDLALHQGVPAFLDVVETVLSELQVERAIVAEEMAMASPRLLAGLKEVLGDISIDQVTHVSFKAMTADAVAVVRSGEYTPYANVILVAGVVF